MKDLKSRRIFKVLQTFFFSVGGANFLWKPGDSTFQMALIIPASPDFEAISDLT